MLGIRYRKMIPNSILQPRHHIIPGLAFNLSTLSLLVAIETTYVFPVPFGCIPIGMIGLPTLLSAYVFLEAKNVLKVKREFKTFAITVVASFSVLMTHELLGVLYTSQKDDVLAQTAVALLLAFLKFVLRVFYSWLLQSHGEMATGMVIFEVSKPPVRSYCLPF